MSPRQSPSQTPPPWTGTNPLPGVREPLTASAPPRSQRRLGLKVAEKPPHSVLMKQTLTGTVCSSNPETSTWETAIGEAVSEQTAAGYLIPGKRLPGSLCCPDSARGPDTEGCTRPGLLPQGLPQPHSPAARGRHRGDVAASAQSRRLSAESPAWPGCAFAPAETCLHSHQNRNSAVISSPGRKTRWPAQQRMFVRGNESQRESRQTPISVP